MELFFKDEVFNIVGAPIEVLGELGPGFLSGTEESQMINYLKATGMRVGILINFGAEGKLEWKRFIK